MLEAADLSGRKVALFGLGDAVGFADTYLNAMGEIGDMVRAAGGILIGALGKRRLFRTAPRPPKRTDTSSGSPSTMTTNPARPPGASAGGVRS